MTDYPRFPALGTDVDTAYQRFHGARLVELVLALVDLCQTRRAMARAGRRQTSGRHFLNAGTAATSIALLLMLVGVALAQESVRLRGTIERVECDTYVIKARSGDLLRLMLAPDASVAASVKSELEDIGKGSYIGVAAQPQPDGSLRALEAHIFHDSMRGVGQGHRPWDLLPRSTMTNATVDYVVHSIDGRTVTLKYKDGEQKIVIPSDVVIVTYLPGRREELAKGAAIFVPSAVKQADGTLKAQRIMVGRNVPPPQ